MYGNKNTCVLFVENKQLKIETSIDVSRVDAFVVVPYDKPGATLRSNGATLHVLSLGTCNGETKFVRCPRWALEIIVDQLKLVDYDFAVAFDVDERDVEDAFEAAEERGGDSMIYECLFWF